MPAESRTNAESQELGRALQPRRHQKSAPAPQSRAPTLCPHLGAVLPAALVHAPEGAFADHFQDVVVLHRSGRGRWAAEAKGPVRSSASPPAGLHPAPVPPGECSPAAGFAPAQRLQGRTCPEPGDSNRSAGWDESLPAPLRSGPARPRRRGVSWQRAPAPASASGASEEMAAAAEGAEAADW